MSAEQTERLQRLREEIEKKRVSSSALLEALHRLAESHPLPNGGTAFLRILEGTFRRNYYTSQSIFLMSNDPDVTGSSAFAVARHCIEDMLSIEWMIINDKERQAKKFEGFIPIQNESFIERIQRIGIDPLDHITQDDLDERKKQFEAAKPQFSSGGKVFRSYNHRAVEGLINDLRGRIPEEVFTERDLNAILYYYLEANDRNHFNPSDVLNYLDHEHLDVSLLYGADRALFASITSLQMLALRYIDEIHGQEHSERYKELREKVVKN